MDGGVLPFHFINTVYAWKGENLYEYLKTYDELLEWCHKVKIFPSPQLDQLREYALKHPKNKELAFEQIKNARNILYRFFSGIAGPGIEQSILQQYNILLSKALVHFEWKPSKNALLFSIKKNETDLLLPLWKIIQSSHQLLLDKEDYKIKECSQCGWIFLDETRNNSRRWCNTATCGSVEKMQRYYQKKLNLRIYRKGAEVRYKSRIT